MDIKLKDILKIEDERRYKVHLATWNGKNQPLDVFVRDKEEWKHWNTHSRSGKNKFSRKYILTLISFYHETDTWLFGGVFEVTGRTGEKTGHIYEVVLTDQFKPFIGRLKIEWKRYGQQNARNLEVLVGDFVVAEILKEPYTGEKFPGYEDISVGFASLRNIIHSEKPDWKAALENVKGVYLITDGKNGKKYVGAAYGEQGIWARWSCYAGTGGHGYTDELTKLIKEKDEKYALENFTFSLLEYRPMKTDDQNVIDRETFWKKALLSREFGYNKN